jgi:pentatricopeptide repeat protein
VNARYPDFKHKTKQKSLWLNGRFKPPWVEGELAAMAPGTLQLDIFSWNMRLGRYVKAGQFGKAMELFEQMQREGMIPDTFTFVRVLNACSGLQALEEGRCIHAQIMQRGCESDAYVGSSLVDMYAKCGSMEDAWNVFNRIPYRNAVTWNAMISGHVISGQGQRSLELFHEMQCEGVQPDPVTFVGVLNACASIGALEKGRHVHEQIVRSGFRSNVFVDTSLIDMYAKCGSIEDACKVFNQMSTHDVVAWSAMILGYVRCGQGHKALELFRQMQQEGLEADHVMFMGVLNACASVGALEEGIHVHKQIIQSSLESNLFVATSLIDMYAKCGSIEDAWKLFSQMPTRNVVPWSVIILGHVTCGQGQKALELFGQMQKEGVEPNSVTFMGVLNACASVAALEEGRHVHEQIIQNGCESDVFVGSSLIDMYAKCGSIEDAQRVFNKMATRNLVSWNAMLRGYAMHGHDREALEHFEQMCEEGFEIDSITFIAILSACSHARLVYEGMGFFDSMGLIYRISATVEHYACMVDLLGRAGHLKEAEDLIKSMPCEANVALLLALLGACRIHGNLEMGERLAKQVLELDPGNVSAYVLLANTCAAGGNWDLSANV